MEEAVKELVEGKTKRQTYEAYLGHLMAERATWEAAWRDIASQMAPYRLQLDGYQANKGERRESNIINSTPTWCLRVLAAGLMAGLTSPVRDWFGLGIEGDDDVETEMDAEAKKYLELCRDIIKAELHKSRWYSVLPNSTWPDVGSLATSLVVLEEGPVGGPLLRFRPYPVGSFYLDVDEDGNVDTLFVTLKMRLRTMVRKFGVDNLSEDAKMAWRRGETTGQWDVVWAVVPNDTYREDAIGPEGMRWSSCWWQPGEPRPNHFLRESGYREFPGLVARWFVSEGDAYGRGPGWEIRGDCRSLQHYEKQLAKMVDKTVEPPMKGSSNVKRGSLLPGDMTVFGKSGAAESIYEPAMTVNPASKAAAEAHIARHEKRIERAMYTDLWLALTNDDRAQRATATEVEEQKKEVMLMLGPLLESMEDGLLRPCILRAFAILRRAGRIPPPPESLVGRGIKIEFVSILHQLQKATGLNAIRTFLMEMHSILAVAQDASDKVDGDVLVDEVAKVVGLVTGAVRSGEAAAKMRAARAEQARAEQEGQAMLAATQGAKNLSGVDPQQLTELAGAVAPAAAAQTEAITAGGGF